MESKDKSVSGIIEFSFLSTFYKLYVVTDTDILELVFYQKQNSDGDVKSQLHQLAAIFSL